ncbi:TPA: hypothetical protein DCZ39_03015 [Patescibacteria group bacterium]|nr:hypothetical protein [Candidatus Gracilibacteria bacterium]
MNLYGQENLMIRKISCRDVALQHISMGDFFMMFLSARGLFEDVINITLYVKVQFHQVPIVSYQNISIDYDKDRHQNLLKYKVPYFKTHRKRFTLM